MYFILGYLKGLQFFLKCHGPYICLITLDCDVMGNFTRSTSAYLPPWTVTSQGILLGPPLFSYFTLTSWGILLGIFHKNKTTYFLYIMLRIFDFQRSTYSYVKTEKSQNEKLGKKSTSRPILLKFFKMNEKKNNKFSYRYLKFYCPDTSNILHKVLNNIYKQLKIHKLYCKKCYSSFFTI